MNQGSNSVRKLSDMDYSTEGVGVVHEEKMYRRYVKRCPLECCSGPNKKDLIRNRLQHALCTNINDNPGQWKMVNNKITWVARKSNVQ